MSNLMSYGNTKHQILAGKCILFESFLPFSDWTKPLRGSLAFDLFVMREL
jgi:hypothetical protein